MAPHVTAQGTKPLKNLVRSCLEYEFDLSAPSEDDEDDDSQHADSASVMEKKKDKDKDKETKITQEDNKIIAKAPEEELKEPAGQPSAKQQQQPLDAEKQRPLGSEHTHSPTPKISLKGRQDKRAMNRGALESAWDRNVRAVEVVLRTGQKCLRTSLGMQDVRAASG
jgi:hypothetical protein